MSLSRVIKQEPKELAAFASQAYHVGVSDALLAIRLQYPQLAEDIMTSIEGTLMEQAFQAVEWRRNVEWVEGVDHSMSPSRTYVSMPIERYRELKALETK